MYDVADQVVHGLSEATDQMSVTATSEDRGRYVMTSMGCNDASYSMSK